MANTKRKCKQCQNYYAQDNEGWMRLGGSYFHNEECAATFQMDKFRKARLAKVDKIKRPAKKVALKDKGLDHHWKITKEVCQKYAKLRDIYYNRPCISCGKHHLKTYITKGSMPTGGHYKTGGAHKNLQFNLWNINMEHLYCNSYDREHLSGMEKNIVDRYGQGRLDFLQSNPPYNRDHSDKAYLARIRKILNKRMKRYL